MVNERCERISRRLRRVTRRAKRQARFASSFLDRIYDRALEALEESGADITAEELEPIILDVIDGDASFEPVNIRLPQPNIPEVCADVTADAEAELQSIIDQVQNSANVSAYVFNPAYGIASDFDGYFSCDNALFVDFCPVEL